jgi:hypothetical protein
LSLPLLRRGEAGNMPAAPCAPATLKSEQVVKNIA